MTSRDEEDAVLDGVVLYDGIYVKDAPGRGYSSLSWHGCPCPLISMHKENLCQEVWMFYPDWKF